MTTNIELADRIDAMNKRYIRKPECKATLTETAELLRNANPVAWQHQTRVGDGEWSGWIDGRLKAKALAAGEEYQERGLVPLPPQ